MTDMILEIWSDGWMGRILMLFIAAIVAVLLFVCGYGVYCAADSWYVDDMDGTAIVVSRSHVDAYYSFVPVGKTTVMQYHPESWTLIMEVAGGTDDFSVTESQYGRNTNGERVRVRYRKGRYSGWTYIKKAWL